MQKILFLALCLSGSFASAAWTDKVKQFESPKENAICQAQRLYDAGKYTSEPPAKSYKSYRVTGMPKYLVRLAFINPMNADGYKSIRSIEPIEDWLYSESLDKYTVYFDVIDKYTTDVCVKRIE